MKDIPRWLWLIWGLLFLLLEGLALAGGSSSDTLTQTIHLVVPGWIVACFIAWLALHFWRTYRK